MFWYEHKKREIAALAKFLIFSFWFLIPACNARGLCVFIKCLVDQKIGGGVLLPRNIGEISNF